MNVEGLLEKLDTERQDGMEHSQHRARGGLKQRCGEAFLEKIEFDQGLSDEKPTRKSYVETVAFIRETKQHGGHTGNMLLVFVDVELVPEGDLARS